MKNIKAKNILLVLFLCVIFAFFCIFAFRVGVKQILIDKFSMNNKFVQMIFQDDSSLFSENINIEWEELYPFDSEDVEKQESNNKKHISNFFDTFEELKSKISNWYTTMFVPYDELIFLSNKIEKTVGWNISSFTEYNSTLELEDGVFVTLYSEIDTGEHIENVTELNNYCSDSGINFLYVNAPSKTTEDDYISGIADFSNQNADALLKGLSDNSVDYIDLRHNIANDGLDNKKLFFKTDHHWKPETGLYATTIISEYLNEKYNFNIDTDKFDISQYKTVTYKGCFLGSQGKKVTLARAEAEDFNLLYPNYKTSFDLVVDDLNINETGDFSLIYDLNYLECDDPMENDLYSAYGYANRPLMRYKNHITNNDSKTLIVKDSFANTVAPFFAMGVDSCDVIDLRYFNGSLKAYISSTNPDCVIVLYSQRSIESIDYTSHFSLFDFR